MRSGFLNILKPPGVSSFGVIRVVKRMLQKGTKIGHMGTLDPDAAGVLPIGIGKATRLFDYVLDKQKSYVAEIRFGTATDTQDASGQVVMERPLPDLEKARAVLKDFVGEIEQRPSMYSAIHVDGKRGYELARQGVEVQMPVRRVEIYSIEHLQDTPPDRMRIRVCCGKGSYIRSLAHDVGLAAGSCAHLSMLIRDSSGAFEIRNATTLEELAALHEEGKQLPLLPMDFPLAHMKKVELPAAFQKKVMNGAFIEGDFGLSPQEHCLVYLQGRFAGIAINKEGGLRFSAMLLEE